MATPQKQSDLHDGEPPEQTPSLAARILGTASTRADEQAPEVPHAALDLAHDGDGKAEHQPPAAANAEQQPQVAAEQGDDARPLDPGLTDLGWAETEQDIAQPLLSGLKNREIWLLQRRFNKQAFRVVRIRPEEDVRDQAKVLNGLDFNIADTHECTPDRLRATLERTYTSVVLPCAAFAKHLARLRSWHETRRSAAFAAFYALAWFFNVTLLSIAALLTLLIVSPRSRRILFPPAPLAAISASTGKPKVPDAEHLGSTQSLTGAAEIYKGQAAEREAANFVNSLSSLAVSTAIGSEDVTGAAPSDGEEQEGDELSSFDDEQTVVGHEGDAKTPLPRRTTTKVAGSAKQPATKTQGGSALENEALPDPSRITSAPPPSAGATDTSHPSQAGQDATAAPVDRAVWSKAAPVLRVLEDLCDTAERFANALSPVAPFHRHLPRARLGAPLLLLALAGALTADPTRVYRASTLLGGFLFYGQPVLDRLRPEPVIAWLDAHVPHWRRYLELRNTLLRGVPTNAQLTVTLLRIGEAHRSPLPPPPLPVAPGEEGKGPKAEAREGLEMADHPDLPPEYREELRRQALEKQQQEAALGGAKTEEEDSDDKKEKEKKKKKPSRILGMFKVAAKSLTTGALGVNRAEATVLQSDHAKARLGVVRKQLAERALGDGPAAFKARYRGQKGLLIISTSSTTPCVSFEPRQPAVARAAIKAVEQMREKEKDGGELSADTVDHSDAMTEGDSGTTTTATKRALEKAAESTRKPPLFSIQIEDIAELAKRGGLGWKAKMLVSWALDSEVADGLEVLTADGKRFRITAMPRRDEVFNRLIALSPKTMWELA